LEVRNPKASKELGELSYDLKTALAEAKAADDPTVIKLIGNGGMWKTWRSVVSM
jgi:hypothetical protein